MRTYLSTKVKKIWASIALLSLELLIVLALFVASVLVFAFLVNRIFRLQKDAFDFQVFEYLSKYISDLNTDIMVFITFFGAHNFLVPANIILISYFLFIKKHRWYSIKVPVVAIGSVAMMFLLKLFFSRPRPLTPLLEDVRGFSFPSGHAMSSMTFYGLLVYLVWKNVVNKWLRLLLVSALCLFILTIGFTRVYLRVHYTSDVLAGLSVGLIWLVLSIYIMGRIEKYTRKEIAPAVSSDPYVN